MSYELFKKIIDELEDESKRLDINRRKSEITKIERAMPSQIKGEISGCFTDTMLNEVKKGKTILKLYGYGEPLLNPSFFKMASYLKHKDFCVRVATNASKLDKETTKKILKLEIFNDILFSLDSHIKETYESIRKGLDSKSIFGNVGFFVEQARKEKDRKPRIVICATRNKKNEKNIQETTNFFRSKGIDAIIEPNIFYRKKFDAHHSISCPLLKHSLSIYSTGEVVKCGIDAIGRSKIGDANEQSLKEIWLSDKNLNYLLLNQTHKLDKIDLCKRFCIK